VRTELLPACRDEVVVYEVTEAAGGSGGVSVRMDKIVESERLTMGVLQFTLETSGTSWLSEIETPRVHAAWHLVPKAGEMTGTLVLLPSGTVARRLAARRSE